MGLRKPYGTQGGLGKKRTEGTVMTYVTLKILLAVSFREVNCCCCCCCCCCVASVVSDSVRPHRPQPTRLPRPWDSPGKNAGVGCHFLLQCMKVKSESELTQSCPTLGDPMDCSLPGSSAHGIFQARVLEWVAIAFSVNQCYYPTNNTGECWNSAWKRPVC